MKRAILLAALLALVLPAVSWSQEPPEEPKRRIVYVPHDQMDALLEKHARGVVLSVSEYLELWRLARQHKLEIQKPPTVAATILTGRITGTVSEEKAVLTAVYTVRVLAEGIQRVAFPVAFNAVGDVTADGRPALVARDSKGEYLLLQGVGDHEVSVELSRKVTRKEELRSVATAVPPGASLTVDLMLPAGTEPVAGTLGGAWRTAETEAGTRVIAYLPPGPSLHLVFRPRRDEGLQSARLHAYGKSLHVIGSRLLRSMSLTEVRIYRAGVRELEFRVSGRVRVTDVTAPDLAGWRVVEGADDSRVFLVLGHDATGTLPVVISAERSLPGPGEVIVPEVRLVGAEDSRGLSGVAYDTGVQGRIAKVDGYARVAIPAPPPAPKKGQKRPPVVGPLLSTASAVYRYWSADRTLTVRTEVREGRVRCDASVMVQLLESSREVHAVLAYAVTGERLFRVSPAFPSEYEMLDLAIAPAVKHTWERRDDGTVVVDFPSGAPAGSTVQLTARFRLSDDEWRDEAWTEREFPVPVPDPGVEDVTGRLAIVADTGFDVREGDLVGLKPEPVALLGFPQARLGYRWRGSGASASLTVERIEPKVSVRHVAVVAPGEKTARYTGFLHYTIRRAGVRRFRFEVGGGLGDRLRVVAPGTIEPARTSGSADGIDLWTVELPQKARGDVLIVLSLEEEMVEALDGSRRFDFPEVRVLDVEDETGYLAVESGDNMRITVTADSLREIGLEEMVFLGGYKPARGLLAAYFCAGHPWSLSLETLRYEDKEVLAAFVKSAHLISVVAEDGVVRTRATYDLLNLDRQFLRVVLADGAVLWGALVAGKPVKPFVGKGGENLVPLRTTVGAAGVRVVLMYEQEADPLAGGGTLSLAAPHLAEITGAEATWDVYLPSDYRVLRSRGVFGGTERAAPDPWLYRVLDVMFASDRAASGPAMTTSGAVDAVETDQYRYGGGGGGGGTREDRGDKARAPAKAEKKSRPRAKAPRREAMPAEKPMEESEEMGMPPPGAATPSPDAGLDDSKPGGLVGKSGAPPAILGLKGGLSLDIPIVPGGTMESVRALGVHGGVSISYVDAPDREALGYFVSVLIVLLGLFVTGVIRWRDEGLRFPKLAYVVGVLAFATLAPAWFGSRETTIWDAVARGAVWSAPVLLIFWAGRRFGGIRKAAGKSAGAAAVAVLTLAVLSAPAFAKGKPKPPPPKDDRETVYVPYDPSNSDLDAGGKVFIPFERYRELWNAAHPDRKITAPEEAPVPWLLTGAGYEGSVEEETVSLRAIYDLVVLKEGWLEIALPLTPAVVEEALVDGEPVRVLSRKGAHVLVLEGKGAHRVSLRLRLVVAKKGAQRGFGMKLPAVPRTLLRFELPIDDAEVEMKGPVAPDVEGRKLTALLGAEGSLFLWWRTKTEAPKIEARVEAETREVLTALEGRWELRLRSRWRVVSGSIREVEIALDPEFVLLSVIGNEVKSFTERDGRLVIELTHEVKKGTTVTVLAERVDGIRERAVALPGFAPLGAVRERGLLAVAFAPELRPTISGSRNLDRIGANPKDYAGLVPAGVNLHSSYRFVMRPLGLDVATEPVAAEVRLELPVLHVIEREWLHGRARFAYQVRGDGTFEFPGVFPADLELEKVQAPGIDRWWREGDRLWFSTKSPVRGQFHADIWFRKRLDPDAERVEIPELHGAGVTHEKGWVLVAHSPGMSLTIAEEDGLVKEPIATFRSWGALRPAERRVYGYRHDGRPFTLAVARSFPEARVHPVATTRLQVLDESVVVDTHFAFAIENAGEDTFEVFLPEGEGEDHVLLADRVRSVAVKDAEDGRGKVLTLVLQQEALGFYGFRIVYEKRLEREEGQLRTGRVVVRGPQPIGESPECYVLVENQSSGEVSFGAVEGVETEDPAGFPFLPRGMDTDLILEGWRGRKAAFSLEVVQVIHGFAEYSDALITSAELLTAVGRDGLMRSRVTYRVLNRTRQFLEITLPAGAQLESVRVAGRAAKPGRRRFAGEERIQIPLARMQAGDVATDVEVNWSLQMGEDEGEDLEGLSDLAIEEPVVHDLEVEKTFYTVVLPEGYRYSFDGNMDPVAETAQQVHALEKATEELSRLANEQAQGNIAQQVRAGENFLKNRGSVETKWKEARDNVDRQMGYLADEDNLRSLTAEQRTKMRKDVKQQLAQLEDLKNKLGDLDLDVEIAQSAEMSSGSSFFGRAGRRGASGAPSPVLGKGLHQAGAKEELAKQKKLVEQQLAQTYNYRGFSNVSGQGWGANDAVQAREALKRLNVYTVQGDRQQVAQSETEGKWRDTFDQLKAAAQPQQQGVQVDAPFDGPASNTAIGIGGGAGGAFPGRARLPGAAERTSGPSGGSGPDTGAADGDMSGGDSGAGDAYHSRSLVRPRPAATAGLMSLPVTVPMTGEVYRFQKQNGGAVLTISPSRPGTGRGVTSFLYFLLIVALLFALYRIRARFMTT